MSLTIKIPTGTEKEEYSLFVNGEVVYIHTENKLGTLLKINGTGVAFYSASNSRRALFQELTEKDHGLPLEEGKLPYIKEKVRILYKARGRKIDLLKVALYNLEKKYKKEIYSLGTLYWLEIASYIDSVIYSKRNSISTKRQSYLITEKNIKRRNRLHENQ